MLLKNQKAVLDFKAGKENALQFNKYPLFRINMNDLSKTHELLRSHEMFTVLLDSFDATEIDKKRQEVKGGRALQKQVFQFFINIEQKIKFEGENCDEVILQFVFWI